MTTLLAIETSTQSCSAALLHEGVVREHFEVAPRRHTDLILPMIQAVLQERAVVTAQLQAIAFSAGPGSFMGTRLAYGVAEGLAYGLSIPVIPVSTLQILAQSAYEIAGCEYVISGWDARMGEVYWGVYHLKNGVMAPLQKDCLSKPDAVVFDDQAVLVGNAWPLYWQRDYVDCYPHAAALARLANGLFEVGRFFSPLDVEPVYLRKSVV